MAKKKKKTTRKSATRKKTRKTTTRKRPGPKVRLTPGAKIEALNMAYFGATNSELALFYGCDEATIRRNLGVDLEKRRAERRFELRKAQFLIATATDDQGFRVADERPDVRLLIWLGKNELGQAETMKLGTGDEPLMITNIDPARVRGEK